MNTYNNQQTNNKLAIGLCTYKRLPSLVRLLDHIAIAAEYAGESPIIIVVDNDGQDTNVEEAVQKFSKQSGLPVKYLIETKPGISAARNAVFAEAEYLSVRFMAMIDDDEWPSQHWLVELLETQDSQAAVIVGGPVRPVFSINADKLQKYVRYWSVDKQYLHGKPFVFCTCNFLIDLTAIADTPRPLFDEAFGLSGGGDTVFFRKLFFEDHPMAWADKALVYEEVPENRASFIWLRQRRFRVGNHAVRWETLDIGKFRSIVKTFGLTARLFVYPFFRREPESPFVGWLLEFDKIRGRCSAHLGDVFVEYSRPSSICKNDLG